MRIVLPPGGRSRRERRREEAAPPTRPGGRMALPPPPEAKPAIVEGRVRSRPQVILPPDEVLITKGQLPAQDKLIRAVLRPMRQVDIIMPRLAEFQQTLDVRHSLVHDVDAGGRLILAQPNPPLSPAHLGQDVELSFLLRVKEDEFTRRWMRLGYSAPVEAIRNDFALANDLRDNVVLVPPPKALEMRTLRLTYRVIPPEEVDLRLFLLPEGTELGLMDISAGGAKFHHTPKTVLEPKQQIKLKLQSGEFALTLDAIVVRQDTVTDRLGRDKPVACVEFFNLESRVRQLLEQLLREMYRLLLAARAGTTPKKLE